MMLPIAREQALDAHVVRVLNSVFRIHYKDVHAGLINHRTPGIHELAGPMDRHSKGFVILHHLIDRIANQHNLHNHSRQRLLRFGDAHAYRNQIPETRRSEL